MKKDSEPSQKYSHTPSPHLNIVVVAYGNGIVGIAAVDARGFGADEHQHRGLPGQGRVQHNVLLVGKLLVQIALQA